jgi:polyhydroxyalkanoate synthesis regulator phasin
MGLGESIDLIRKYKTKDILMMSNLLSSVRSPLFKSSDIQFKQAVLDTKLSEDSKLAFICKTSILTANDHKPKQIFARSNISCMGAWDLFTPLLNSTVTADENLFNENHLLHLVRLLADQDPLRKQFKDQLARFYALMEMLPPTIPNLNYSPSSRFQEITNLSISDFMTIGFGLYIQAVENRTVPIENLLIDGHEVFNRSKVKLFLAQTQADYNEFRNIAESRAQTTGIPEQERYAYNPLYEKPIIKCQDGTLVVPVVQMLQQRITWGIYYMLLEADGQNFTNEFGKIFEKYVGELLSDMTGSTDLIAEMSGKVNKSEAKGPADWLWMKEKDLVLIECKKSMLTLNTKTRNSIQDVESNINTTLRKAMKQLTKNINHLKNNVWSIPGFSSDTKVFTIIITLGNFYFGNTDILLQFAKQEFNDLEEVCQGVQNFSIETLELIAKYYTRDELIEFIKYKLSDPDRRTDDFHNSVVEYKKIALSEIKPKSKFLQAAYDQFFSGLEN